jgi:hypothetical protein
MLKTEYNLSGYITITEDQGRWDLPDSLLPVVLQADDFVTMIQDEDGNQGFDESQLVKHLYQLDYNIWESIVRDAINSEVLPIDHTQIHRFLSPVISDHNNNLLCHFSYNKVDKLEHIIELPGFQEYYLTEKKMFPIYFNYFGETHITMALAAHDYASFYRLMHLFIRLQSCTESSFLLSKWLLKAFREGLNIVPLLNSQVLHTVLDGEIIEHWHQWPQFHVDCSIETVNYDQPFLVLLHDESAYANLFSRKYPADKSTGEFRLEAVSRKDMKGKLHPMAYFAEKLPMHCQTKAEQFDLIFELFEILAETEQKDYFLCGFI